MAFSPTNSVCAPISVEHARKQSLSTTLDIRFKLSCSQALCAHVRADYARARILYTMMPPGVVESKKSALRVSDRRLSEQA